MSRRGSRRRIAANVYDDDTGRVIIYRDHDGRQRELRRPPFTPIKEMRADVVAALAASSASGIPKTATDTLAAAIDRWEELEQGLASWKERRAELRAWARADVDGKPLGLLRLRGISAAHARIIMSQWARAGVAPKTIRNRRWSLQHLFRVLYGPKAVTPVDDIPPPPKTKTIPIPIEPSHVLDVLQNLIAREAAGLIRDAKTRARFMLRAATGKRPAEIMRAKPSDVNLERREWRVRDAKGGWSEGLYLNDEMIAAWKLFIAADAWGDFNTGAHAETLRQAGWAPGGDSTVRPYELRHSVGIALSDAGVDLADISGVLGHKDMRTTRQTYVPIRQARMQRASERLNGRFNGWKVPANVPAIDADQRGHTRKNTEAVARRRSEGETRRSQRKTGRK